MTDYEGNALFFQVSRVGFKHHQFSFLSGIIIVEFLLLCLLILSLWKFSQHQLVVVSIGLVWS
jgi:hypothetical protein